MSIQPIYYIPIATTLFSLYFFVVIYKHWLTNTSSMHVFWWMLGVFFYGAGTVTESLITLTGLNPINIKAWYILGALLGGAPLAQGTVYLLMKRQTANLITIAFLALFLVSAVLVVLSPIHLDRVQNHKPNVKVFEWQFILVFIILLNTYAFAFLVGGAVYSAVKYARNKLYEKRFQGNLLIALGGLLPGIGGSFTRLGYVEVLYVTEFLGILLIYAGYRIIRNDSRQFDAHKNEVLYKL